MGDDSIVGSTCDTRSKAAEQVASIYFGTNGTELLPPQETTPLLRYMFSRYVDQLIMEKEPYDPYYRELPSNLVPVRTPFTRPGRYDAGQVFIYLTNKVKRWSLLLDKTHVDSIYDEARQLIPRGISQFWLLEKRYSTHKLGVNSVKNRIRSSTEVDQSDSLTKLDRQDGSGRTLVVLREPEHSYTRQSDILSYHFNEAEAVTAAESYTRRHHRRAVVGLLLWDEAWW